MSPSRFTTRRKRFLVAPLLACVVAATLPRDAVYEHEHAGGDRAHVHAWNGSSVDDLVALAHDHGAGHRHGDHDHHHHLDHAERDRHPADAHERGHARASGDRSSRDGGPGIVPAHVHRRQAGRDPATARDRKPGLHRMRGAVLRHAHTQLPFQLATSAASPALAPSFDALAALAPLPPQAPAGFRAAARARSPPPRRPA